MLVFSARRLKEELTRHPVYSCCKALQSLLLDVQLLISLLPTCQHVLPHRPPRDLEPHRLPRYSPPPHNPHIRVRQRSLSQHFHQLAYPSPVSPLRRLVPPLQHILLPGLHALQTKSQHCLGSGVSERRRTRRQREGLGMLGVWEGDGCVYAQ